MGTVVRPCLGAMVAEYGLLAPRRLVEILCPTLPLVAEESRALHERERKMIIYSRL